MLLPALPLKIGEFKRWHKIIPHIHRLFFSCSSLHILAKVSFCRNCTLNMFLLVVNLNETSRATSKQVHSKHSCTNEELSLYSGKPNLGQGVRIVLWCTRMLMLHRPQIATNYNFKSILVGMYIYIYRVLAINSLTFSKCWLRSKKIMFWSLDWYVTC